MSVSQSELQEMRKLTLFSKRLSNWHLKNLNAWPSIAFDKFQKAEIDYSIGDRSDECYINYLIRFKGDKPPKDFQKRCKALEKWVKDLFWADMSFAVKSLDGKTLYPEEVKNERK